MKVEDIARVCHEANRAIQLVTHDPFPAPLWDEASQAMQNSAMDGVIHALEGLSPEQLHQSWCDYKTVNGWVYGVVKSEAALTHPCLVPYEQLPLDQQVKDHLFAAIVNTLAKA